MDILGRSVLTENVLVTKSIITKLPLSRQLFIENSYAEFHENKTDSLVVDTASRMNKRTCSANGAFTFLYTGRLQLTPLNIRCSYNLRYV